MDCAVVSACELDCAFEADREVLDAIARGLGIRVPLEEFVERCVSLGVCKVDPDSDAECVADEVCENDSGLAVVVTLRATDCAALGDKLLELDG